MIRDDTAPARAERARIRADFPEVDGDAVREAVFAGSGTQAWNLLNNEHLHGLSLTLPLKQATVGRPWFDLTVSPALDHESAASPLRDGCRPHARLGADSTWDETDLTDRLGEVAECMGFKRMDPLPGDANWVFELPEDASLEQGMFDLFCAVGAQLVSAWAWEREDEALDLKAKMEVSISVPPPPVPLLPGQRKPGSM